MKKALLLLLSLGLLGGLSSCGPSNKDNNDDFDDIDPSEQDIHATSMEVDPKQPFYLKVNDTKKLTAKLDPSPSKNDEKTFTWSIIGKTDVVEFVEPSTSNSISIRGKKTGAAQIKVVNDYSRSFTKTFDVNVIDYDAKNTYLWEYNSTTDRKQFGYDSDSQKLGVQSGTATLGSLDWDFVRDKLTSLQSLNGGIGFGKGKEPETHVHLETNNQRPVKSIVLETGSAEGLANVTVKVGDQEVIIDKAPVFVDRHCGKLEALNLEDLTGKISIDFETPDYDSSKKDDPSYKAPGAVVLKSIWITYAEESFDFVTEKTYDFKSMYEDTEGDFFKKLTQTGKEMTLEDSDFVIKFANIANSTKKDDALVGYAKSNGDIEVLAKKTGEVIKQVQFTYQCANTPVHYDIYSSIVGSAPYDKVVAIGDNNGVSSNVYREHVNAINLSISRANYVGLKSLTIKTVAGTHAVIDSVKLADDAKPDRDTYYAGEKFDPKGLGDVTITFNQSSGSIDPILYSSENLVFYDGQSYVTDPSNPSEILQEETTFVVALFCGKEIKVPIQKVQMKMTTFEKIKSISDLADGNYLITSPGKKKVLKSSADDIDSKAAVETLTECDFGDSISLNYLFENELFKLEKIDDSYHIATLGGRNIGMTAGHELSVTSKTPAYPNWNISVNEDGIVTLNIVDNESVNYYFAWGNSTFKLQDTNPMNISLYKISE